MNILTCIVWIPLVIYDTLNDATSIEEDGTLSEIICTIMLGIASAISSLVMFAHLLIAIDQHLAVVDSLHYHRRINEKVCNVLCLSMWTLGVTLGLLSSVKFNETKREHIYELQDNTTQTNHTCHSCSFDKKEFDISS